MRDEQFAAILTSYEQWKTIQDTIAINDLEIVLFDVGADAVTAVPVTVKIDDDLPEPPKPVETMPRKFSDDFDDSSFCSVGGFVVVGLIEEIGGRIGSSSDSNVSGEDGVD